MFAIIKYGSFVVLVLALFAGCGGANGAPGESTCPAAVPCRCAAGKAATEDSRNEIGIAQQQAKHISLIIPSDAPSKGPKNARLVIQIISNIEDIFAASALLGKKTCETCETDGFAKALVGHEKDVRIVFRPSLSLKDRRMAEPSLEAAYEGQAQNGDSGFWCVHDTISEWIVRADEYMNAAVIDRAAIKCKLNKNEVRRAMSTHRYKERLERESAMIENSGVARGVPTFVVGDLQVLGAQSEGNFRRVINKALQSLPK